MPTSKYSGLCDSDNIYSFTNALDSMVKKFYAVFVYSFKKIDRSASAMEAH
jgi:hypothetical protein